MISMKCVSCSRLYFLQNLFGFYYPFLPYFDEVKMYDRESMWGLADQKTFDVLILGGDINGACLFDRLKREGYKVLIVDKNDFGSDTIQASGMMIWGGLLCLRNFDLTTVFRLSRARDMMIKELKENISPRNSSLSLRYYTYYRA